MSGERAEPLVTFYHLIETGWQHLPAPKPPERATPDAYGQLNSDAFRICEPARQASQYGYLLFPPMDIDLRFDGGDWWWSWNQDGFGAGEHFELLSNNVHYPEYPAVWNVMAPDYLQGMPPPLIGFAEHREYLQVWTGLIARTKADWSLWIKSPTNNEHRSLGYTLAEGIIATDRWGGHLFVLLQALQTNVVFTLRAHRPFAQAVPVPRDVYNAKTLDQFVITNDVPAAVWQDYGNIVLGKLDGSWPRGAYAAAERRRAHE